jgi:hypothetical protein
VVCAGHCRDWYLSHGYVKDSIYSGVYMPPWSIVYLLLLIAYVNDPICSGVHVHVTVEHSIYYRVHMQMIPSAVVCMCRSLHSIFIISCICMIPSAVVCMCGSLWSIVFITNTIEYLIHVNYSICSDLYVQVTVEHSIYYIMHIM